MTYIGRMTAVFVVFISIVGIRIYAYLYLGYPITAPPFMGIVFLWIAYQAGKQYDKVKFLSEKDSLTACYNRRFVGERFPELLSEMNKRGRQLSIALLDCDNFKQINDTYGHIKGDLVLQEIAALLLDNSRSNDLVVRWGGDEFLIVAPFTNKEEIKVMIERFEKKLKYLSENRECSISVSSGFATYPTDAQTIDDLIQIADSNMYLLKQNRK